jgi:hypothetical protein
MALDRMLSSWREIDSTPALVLLNAGLAWSCAVILIFRSLEVDMLSRLAFQLLCYAGAIVAGALLCGFTGVWIFPALFGAVFFAGLKGVI